MHPSLSAFVKQQKVQSKRHAETMHFRVIDGSSPGTGPRLEYIPGSLWRNNRRFSSEQNKLPVQSRQNTPLFCSCVEGDHSTCVYEECPPDIVHTPQGALYTQMNGETVGRYELYSTCNHAHTCIQGIKDMIISVCYPSY